MDQLIAALVLAGGAFYGVYRGAVYAADRLIFQLQEERRLSEERLDAEAKRLEMQLDAESTRLAKQLDAESKRLDRQLSAERAKQDRAELRDILDDGAILLARASEWLQATRSEIESPTSEQPVIAKYELESRPKKTAGFGQLSDEMDRYWQRLMLRFRVADDIPKAISSARKSFNAAMTAIAIKREDLDGEKFQRFKDHRDKFEDSHAGFLAECRNRFGVTPA